MTSPKESAGGARPAHPSPRQITDDETLARSCRRWRALAVIGVDTEFVRERTFYAALGLVQIASGDEIALVDTVALGDLSPLAELLTDPAVTKVFHGCGEDLEVLYHRFGEFPRSVFDTQLAAGFTGHGYPLGYARLVQELYRVEVPKDETRTDWLRRPLAARQVRYAALDVAYLLPLYRQLDAELARLGRREWLQEEVETLADEKRFLPAPEKTYRRIKGAGRLTAGQLTVLRELAAWRELTARRLDLPRSFVVRDAALLALAQRQPRDSRALARLDDVHPREARRHGAELLQIVRTAREAVARGELAPPMSAVSLARHRQVVKQLQTRVAGLADDLGVPPELLASRKVLERLLRRILSGKQPLLPRSLRGWREPVIGDLLSTRALELLPK